MPDEDIDRPRRRSREEDEEDDDDDRPRRRTRRARDDEGDATGGLIPYKNPKALLAYYVGVFSLVPIFALIVGPVAVVLGWMGLKYAKAHPRSKGTAHAVVGIVLGSLTFLGNVALILLAVINVYSRR